MSKNVSMPLQSSDMKISNVNYHKTHIFGGEVKRETIHKQ